MKKNFAQIVENNYNFLYIKLIKKKFFFDNIYELLVNI
jgi:hypothetical protein